MVKEDSTERQLELLLSYSHELLRPSCRRMNGCNSSPQLAYVECDSDLQKRRASSKCARDSLRRQLAVYCMILMFQFKLTFVLSVCSIRLEDTLGRVSIVSEDFGSGLWFHPTSTVSVHPRKTLWVDSHL